jgi:3-oxo-5-alpha-steroid 4-dehydrogenase 1
MTEAVFHRDLTWAYLVTAVAVFVSLFFIPAAYGRHSREGWGPTMNTRLAWVVMECPSVFLFAGCWLIAAPPVSLASGVLGALWIGHYVHRTFIFPFRMQMGNRPTAVVIPLMGFLFNCGNAYLNGRWIFTLSGAYDAAWLSDPRFLVGVSVFAAGWFINYRSDRILAGLRKPGETGYKIPYGGLYRWISCPNYFGEILEWTGFAIACWSLPAVCFVVWTAANLAPRARTHHAWYRRTFADYPASRSALIPGLW